MKRQRSPLLVALAIAVAVTVTTALAPTGEKDAASTASSVAITAYLKIENIEGEATARGHEGWITVQSFEWQMGTAGATTAGATRRAGSVQAHDLVVMKGYDRSSPALALACARGNRFSEAQLVFYQGSTRKATITLTDVMISSTNLEGTDAPMERVSLTYSRIQWQYQYPDAQGRQRTVSFGWDIAQNRSI